MALPKKISKNFKVKKEWFLLLFLPAAIFGGLFIAGFEKRVASAYVLKPNITTTVSTKRFTPPATASAQIHISEEVLSAKTLPENFVTAKGDNLLVLVNKSISLPASYVPVDLVYLSSLIPGSLGQMRSEAAIALKDMFTAATEEGLHLTVVSPYRSYAQQVAVFNGWVQSAGLASAENFSAHAGHSQHQLGTAVDLGAIGQNPLSQKFADTKEGAWVAANAASYGFVLSYPQGKEALTGYMYEPWHYRYIGRDNAQKMLSSGLILEAYLRKYGVW